MANRLTYQILRDTNTEAVIKLTGVFDGSGPEANGARIQANTLAFALDANSVPLRSNLSLSNTSLSYYDLQVTGIKYYVDFPTANVGAVELYWNGAGSNQATQYANSTTIMHLNYSGSYGFGEQTPSIWNNAANSTFQWNNSANVVALAAPGVFGDIGIQTTGAAANAAYTIVVSLRKNNQSYSRGQFQDSAAFNFGPYKVTP